MGLLANLDASNLTLPKNASLVVSGYTTEPTGPIETITPQAARSRSSRVASPTFDGPSDTVKTNWSEVILSILNSLTEAYTNAAEVSVLRRSLNSGQSPSDQQMQALAALLLKSAGSDPTMDALAQQLQTVLAGSSGRGPAARGNTASSPQPRSCDNIRFFAQNQPASDQANVGVIPPGGGTVGILVDAPRECRWTFTMTEALPGTVRPLQSLSGIGRAVLAFSMSAIPQNQDVLGADFFSSAENQRFGSWSFVVNQCSRSISYDDCKHRVASR
jgi:hypothetical protein